MTRKWLIAKPDNRYIGITLLLHLFEIARDKKV